MRTTRTNNPAFRNLRTAGGGYAGFNDPGLYTGGGGYPAAPSAAGADYRPMTVDDVVTKTATTFAVAVIAGVLTAYSGLYILALPALLVGLGVSLYIIFRRKANAGLVLTYAVAEGVLLGAITGVLEFSGTKFAGIGLQAIVGTAGVFTAMLIVYKTGAVRVTPRLTKWIIGAAAGVFVLMLLNLVVGLFNHGGIGLRDGSPLAYVFSIVCIGIAAFSLLIDFDVSDQLIRQGVPAKNAWYVAFGLMVTLVWLYLEILRLLTYLRNN